MLRETDADTFLALLMSREIAATNPPTLALFSYGEPLVRAAIHEAKYHGSTRAFELLATVLADTLPQYLADHSVGAARATVVPIPLGRKRRRERGYNQVEEVGKRAVALMHDPSFELKTLLARARETPTQVSLSREARRANMQGAFAFPHPPARERYVILDDVLTTGATMHAAIEALRIAGVALERIFPVALAYQP